MTESTDFTEREMALVGLLTARFRERDLSARIVSVHRLEGGEEQTLRLTLDDTVSTDFARSRIAASEDVAAMAEEAASELMSPASRIGP